MPDQREEVQVLTSAAVARLQAELDELIAVRRPDISERIRRAREHGDIRENAEYDAAKDEQGMIEARIRQLEWTLKHALIQETPASADEVAPGTIVELREAGAEPEVYLVAASSEERARGARTVTVRSPLGQALLGRRPGEMVTYEAPGGSFTYEVVSIRPWDGA